jgi:hypothetical protein
MEQIIRWEANILIPKLVKKYPSFFVALNGHSETHEISTHPHIS